MVDIPTVEDGNSVLVGVSVGVAVLVVSGLVAGYIIRKRKISLVKSGSLGKFWLIKFRRIMGMFKRVLLDDKRQD